MKVNLNEIKQLFLCENNKYEKSFNSIELNVSVDSRETKVGDLFVCIKGLKTDGHIFINEAIEKGAIGVLVENKNFLKDCAYLQFLTKSTEESLINAAKILMNNNKSHNVAITGSAGKTTTKDFVYSIFKETYSTQRTLKNYNTPIGVPLSIINSEPGFDYFFIELSASYPGEIDKNLEYLKFDSGIITGIGPSHLQYIGSIENVYYEKTKIINCITNNGILLVNGDQEYGYKIKNENKNVNTVLYGFDSSNDLQALNIRMETNQSVFDIRIGKEMYKNFKINLTSYHLIADTLPGIYLGLKANIDIESIKIAINRYNQTDGRGKVSHYKQKVILIDESYNANPFSFTACIKSFANTKYKRKIIVMGDMLELGKESADLHFKIGCEISKTDIFAVLYYQGEYKTQIKEALKNSKVQLITFSQMDEIKNFIDRFYQRGDAFMFKASNGIGLHGLVKKMEMESFSNDN